MDIDPSALASVAVFPLPDVVFFPGERLPLHIFEPRYRQLVRDLIEGRAEFVVIPRMQRPTAARPEDFASIATMGRLLAHDALADGRYHVLVEGVCRVRTHEIASDRLYRKVRCELVAEPEGEAASVTEADAVALRMVVDSVLHALNTLHPGLNYKPSTSRPPATLAWNIAANMVPDADVRQTILEAASANERVCLTTEALSEVLTRLPLTPQPDAN